jgi:transcriptional regulator
MYQPPHHREDRLDVQHQLIENYPLGLLISSSEQGLTANSIPFLLLRKPETLGLLEGHLARANDQWRNIDGQQVLVVFQGPQNYISPSYYETKRETGKVVPTWNYVMVQARGIVRLRDDQTWLDKQVAALTLRQEAGHISPWSVSDAPRSYIESQLRGIVGLEIEMTALEGKWKVSQNRQEADRQGVAEGLSESNAAMAEIVSRYGKS